MKFFVCFWIFFFGFQAGINYSQSSTTFRGKGMNNLLDELSNDAFTSSSHQENFYAYRARFKEEFDKTGSRNNGSGLAWCPKDFIGPGSMEYIQVEFDELKSFSNLFSYGMDSGNIGFYVSKFYLDYQREEGPNWLRYKNEEGHTEIKGNSDSRNVQITSFKSNIVAKRIKIIPISDKVEKICMRFSLYGWNFTDGIVEYIIPQGDFFYKTNKKYELYDRAYDGDNHPGSSQSGRKKGSNNSILSGGMGQLTDNVLDSESISTIDTRNFNFVGWKKINKNRKIEMIFRFDKIRTIYEAKFHVLNNKHVNISVFSSAIFEFSIGGVIYGVCSPNISFTHQPDLQDIKTRWVNVTLQNSFAKFLRITFEFQLEWIVFTEVSFKTKLLNKYIPVENPEPKLVNSIESEPTKIFFASKINYLLIIFCAIISFVGLLCIISICVLRLRRQRKRRIKGKPIHSIRYGNMTCNNVIPIPAVSSSNGGFYKPVPNGVYDCMPGFQSQTLNIRKVPTYPNQQLFGTYSNRKNNSATTVMSSLSPENYGGTLSHLVGQQNMNMFCPDNKRASYDGSYAGTGSNPEYSNASLEKSQLPVHLVPVSPTMYEQFQTNPLHGLPNTQHSFNLMSPALSSFNQDTHQPFIDNFPVNSIAPSMINNYGQSLTPNGFLYQPSNQSFDSSIILWPDELAEMIDKHSRYDVVLGSPVGGSMMIREKFDNESLTVKDYEEELIGKLPKIDIEKFELQKLIGSGRYGSIQKGIHNGSVVVMKGINRDCVPSVRAFFLKMVSDLIKISSKNIANVIGYCQYPISDSNDEFPSPDILSRPSISYIIMQHTHHGYLHKFIRRHSRPVSGSLVNTFNNKNNSDTSCTTVEDDIEETNSKPLLSHSCLIYMAAQISDGMSYLEQAGIIHRDLATRNCLVGPKLSILITDIAMDSIKFEKDYISLNNTLSELTAIGMDINRKVNTYQSALPLPLQWMSWEAALKTKFSSKSDVWSFGVLFWDLLTYCEYRPYFCVSQNMTTLDQKTDYVKCLSLLYNFKCLEQGFDNALLPNNESLSQIRKGTLWTMPLPLPVPSQIVNISTDRRIGTVPTPRIVNRDNSINCILDSNREIRDLISSCWSIEPSNRPKFKDITTFLRQKINNFNVDEEYQYFQSTIRS